MAGVTAVPEQTTVLIVGAGPTGLTAALRLAQLGIPFVLLDAAATPTSTSNAALVHASTLELLAELGVGDALVGAGRRMHRIVMVDRGRPLLRVELADLPSRYAFALSVPQSTTENLLLRRLAELGGSVRRRHRVGMVRPDGDGVLVTGIVETFDEPPFDIRARYVIGADGSHSAVRAAVGVDFPGETYPSRFVLADVALTDGEQPDDEVTVTMSPAGVTVIARLPGGTCRIVATVGSDVDLLPVRPGRAFVDGLLRDRGVRARPTAEPVWSSGFRVHHRIAARFQVGRVFLAGDAAHVHSPAAGQGMNTGIADAFDLSTRLAAVCGGPADESTLDDYERLRRAVALEVLRFTDRLTRTAMLRNPAARSARRVAARTLGRSDAVQRRLAMWVTGLQRSPLRGDLPAVPPRRLAPSTG